MNCSLSLIQNLGFTFWLNQGWPLKCTHTSTESSGKLLESQHSGGWRMQEGEISRLMWAILKDMLTKYNTQKSYLQQTKATFIFKSLASIYRLCSFDLVY